MSERLLILPSDVTTTSFPNNTSTSYTTVLTKPIDKTEKDLTISLQEISIPFTFYNIEDEFYIKITLKDNSIKMIFLEGGVYSTAKDFELMLYHKLKNQPCAYTLSCDGEFTLKGNDIVKSIELHPKLMSIMGIELNQNNKKIMKGTHPFEEWANHKILFVECSAIAPCYFNNDSRKILQSVNLPKKIEFGESFSMTYNVLDFQPIEGERHSCVTIKLTDFFHEPIKLRSGTVLSKLIIYNESGTTSYSH